MHICTSVSTMAACLYVSRLYARVSVSCVGLLFPDSSPIHSSSLHSSSIHIDSQKQYQKDVYIQNVFRSKSSICIICLSEFTTVLSILTVFNSDSSIFHPLTASCGDQLRHHPIHDAARVGAAAPGGRQGVQLVEEEDAGRQVPGVLEERPASLQKTRGSHEKTGGKLVENWDLSIKIFKNGMVTMRKWLVVNKMGSKYRK